MRHVLPPDPTDRVTDLPLQLTTFVGREQELPGQWTQREREVAVLVAQGLGNREIAATLVLSIRTVESHVTHVMSKLDLRSRAQVAVWVVEHGLWARSAV
jgi:DNA-binding NarL/FixJ family response regulator